MDTAMDVLDVNKFNKADVGRGGDGLECGVEWNNTSCEWNAPFYKQ